MPPRRLCIGFIAAATLSILAHYSIARELTKDERKSIASVVQEMLKDPEAAKFTWPPLISQEYYCGIVNGKNSYGGYVGDAPFIVGLSKGSKSKLTPTSLDIGKPSDDSGTTAEILRTCREIGYALDLNGSLPSALAKRSTRDAREKGYTTMTPEEVDQKYQQLSGRLDRAEGVCKLPSGEFVALARSVCESRRGRVLGY